ncbi:MarR family transcriptional regulator [Altererythrobacter indicus]|uniref:MarR family transcriptional regulator n=1 Tax=Altericroceibacterium indicum TaxID=374177 RepID=A0A845ABW3_9SPHN|nr:MarR family transcriptional regulator [Altericroceibacterium indicum]MXP26036.1 MarR family transcriptional regulator [Altericroceibacterium indicum]
MPEPSTDAGTETLSFGPLENLFGYQLRRAWTILRKDFTASVEGLGVRHLSFSLLSLISDNPGINQGKAGEMLDIQRPNMVSLINEMNERGWVERRTDLQDRRALSLYLTEEGQRILAESFNRIEAHEEVLLGQLSSAEKDQLFDMLKRISAS